MSFGKPSNFCWRGAGKRGAAGVRRGAGEVQERCWRGAGKFQERCSKETCRRGAAEGQGREAQQVRRGAGEVQERCRRGAGEVQERSGKVQERSGEVQERCRRGAGKARAAEAQIKKPLENEWREKAIGLDNGLASQKLSEAQRLTPNHSVGRLWNTTEYYGILS